MKLGYGHIAIAILIVIFIILGLCIGVIGNRVRNSNFIHEGLEILVWLAAVSFGCVVLYGGFQDQASSEYTVEKEVIETYGLKALRTVSTQDLHGGAALSFAYVSMETREYYSVMIQETDGGCRKNQYSIARTKIYEVDGNYRAEVVKTIACIIKDEKKMKWFPPKEIQGEAIVKYESEIGIESYKLYIPKGSIIESYEPM